jgi:hypothetical protein
MAEMTLRIEGLPAKPLDAAAWFHANCVQEIRADFRTMQSSPCHLTIVFDLADHEHRGWRLIAIQALAKEVAPIHRINAVASNSEAAIAAAKAYLESADGITGQLLDLDDTGAGEVVTSPT